MEKEGILRVSLVQYDIAWEDKQKNLDYIHETLKSLRDKTDLVILPEMCTTGFSMNSHNLSETTKGNTVTTIKQWSKEYDVAICGSFIAEDNGQYYNRGFFITTNGEYYYDKRHLFRMGKESQYFSAGINRLIIEHNGFNICLLICYDLRFPVWARNIENEYDLLVYVANWPASRTKVWNSLLTTRAIENMAYVCGINRIGKDGNGIDYIGGSQMIDAKGNELCNMKDEELTRTICINKNELQEFRDRFPVWKDGDIFNLRL